MDARIGEDAAGELLEMVARFVGNIIEASMFIEVALGYSSTPLFQIIPSPPFKTLLINAKYRAYPVYRSLQVCA